MNPFIQSSIFMILSSFSCLASDIFTKKATLPLPQLLFIRFFLSFILLIIFYVCTQKTDIKRIFTRNNCFRGSLFALSMNIFSFCLKELSLGMVILLNFTTPIFTTILSKIILKEKFEHRLYTCLINMIGIGFSVYSELNITNKMAIIGSVIAAMCFSSIDIFNKSQANKDENLLEILIGSSFFSMLLCINPQNALGFSNISLINWIYSIGVSITAVLIPLFMLKATKNASNISALQPLKYIEFPLSIIAGYLFFNETHSYQIFVGFCVIIIGTTFSYLKDLKNN